MKPLVHVAKPQLFTGSRWIAIFSSAPNTPTLWIYFGEDMSPDDQVEAEIYAEKIAALINGAAAKEEED
jgi:hypothetical protein